MGYHYAGTIRYLVNSTGDETLGYRVTGEECISKQSCLLSASLKNRAVTEAQRGFKLPELVSQEDKSVLKRSLSEKYRPMISCV